MAAPSTVYKDYMTRRRKGGSPNVDIDLYIAKFLQNTTAQSGDTWGDGYFNSTDTEAQKIAKIKDIFKIDGWNAVDYAQQKAGTITISGTAVTGSGTAFTTDFIVGQKVGVFLLIDDELKCVETYRITAITSATAMSVVAGTNRSGVAYCNYHQGWTGYCYSRTSGNGLYHNWDNNTSPFVARGSGVRVPTTVNASAELLTDGALNRKADIEITTAEPHWANWINLDISLRSAYYTSTTDYGYSWKIGAGSYTDVSTFTTSLAPKLPRAERVRGIFITGLDPEETIYFKPWVTNEEGTFYGTETYFTADELLWTDGAFGVASASGAVTEAYLLFATAADAAALSSVTTSDASTGIFLYLNEYFVSGNLLPTGYYVIGAETTKAYYVVNGEVRKYETRTPATASVRFSLINLGVEEYPEWRVIAQTIDAASGFPNTLTVATVVTYYTESGGIYTQTGNPVNVDIDLTSGDFNAQSALSLNPPPSGATYARVTTSETGIGLAVISPYVAI